METGLDSPLVGSVINSEEKNHGTSNTTPKIAPPQVKQRTSP
jgi:hypothetical protein